MTALGATFRDAGGTIGFPGRAEAQAYVASSGILWPDRMLPPFEGELRVRRETAVFVAET